jgi:hypothetical protein
MTMKRRTAIPMRSTRGVTGPIIQYTNFDVSERNDREQRVLSAAASPGPANVDAAVARVKNQTARKTTGGAVRTETEDAVIQNNCSEGEGEIQASFHNYEVHVQLRGVLFNEISSHTHCASKKKILFGLHSLST